MKFGALVPSAVSLGVALTLAACKDNGHISPREAGSPSHDSEVGNVKLPPWQVSTSHNELSGEIEMTAVNGFGDHALVVRQRGKKLECYVSTGDFLLTVDNIETRRSPVKYKFDEEPIIQEAWTISADNTALFYPGNPRAFLRKMAKAKRLIIEYSPSDKVPQTESFDLSPLPRELTETLSR